jgi:hypothetical protein
MEILQEFPNLKFLTCKRHTNEKVEMFDPTLEKCQSLESVNIEIYPDNTENLQARAQVLLDLAFIVPRTGISTVRAACVRIMTNHYFISCANFLTQSIYTSTMEMLGMKNIWLPILKCYSPPTLIFIQQY